MMKKRQQETIDAIIFIDTNIFLDFYRIADSGVSIKYLEQIEEHKDLMVTSCQVEMEFKKNRQKVLLNALPGMKIPPINLSIPPIVQDTEKAKKIKLSIKALSEEHMKLEDDIANIFIDPTNYDPVYKTLNNLFEYKSPLNLTEENEMYPEISSLAEKRFKLGYPPRKNEDLNIGDAINWEWLMHCAIKLKKDVIIVTRDNDYGTKYNKQPYLNDWLKQEFQLRVGENSKIILTNKLATAFQMVKIPVSEEMIQEEAKIIDFSDLNTRLESLNEFSSLGKRLSEAIKFSGTWQRVSILSKVIEDFTEED
jgi:hypothetical protein